MKKFKSWFGLVGVVAIAIVFSMAITGCSGGSQSSGQAADQPAEQAAEPEPLNLDGAWKQVNGSSDSYQGAIIENGTITIYWISDVEETESLYWVGTYTAPDEPTDTWTWVSENDHSQTDMAMLASSDDTKEFTYENGQIVYKASAFGTTKTIRLERVK